MILRWWFRLAFWFRRGWRRPIESLEPWVGDSRSVERRLLVAHVALRLAEDLRVYPLEVVADVLSAAGELVRGNDRPVGQFDRTSGFVIDQVVDREQPRQSPIMCVWWALVALGVTVGLLAAFTAARADERRIDLYDSASRRGGYAVVDERSGRIDVYDAASRRLGYGTVDRGVRRDSGSLYSAAGRRFAPSSMFLSRETRR